MEDKHRPHYTQGSAMKSDILQLKFSKSMIWYTYTISKPVMVEIPVAAFCKYESFHNINLNFGNAML